MQITKRTIAALVVLLLAVITTGHVMAQQPQITAPNATESFATDYSSSFINSGGDNDLVFVFCGNQDEPDVGELEVDNAGGCSVSWFEFDGVSYQPMGITGVTASELTSGGYMAQVDCSGTITCHRAWVWVNQTFVDVEEIEPSCEEFTLHGEFEALDTVFDIVDPPGMNFEVDEETEILVCFWADHTYVSDIGFYLKAPGHEADEPEYPVNLNGNHAVVELLPPVSNWGNSTTTGSTSIPASALGCSNPDDVNTVCQSGNNVENFCFSTTLEAGNPSLTPCVCDMSVPLSNTYASVGPWDPIYGYNAGDDGWVVQIYDCEEYDYGSLNQVLISFTGNTACGETSFIYNSGDISGLPSSEINDNSCDAATASYFIVPPEDPPGAYTVTSSITDYYWTCDNTSFTSSDLNPTLTPGTAAYPTETSNFSLHVTETIDVSGSPSCEQTATEEFITLPADATISPIAPMCADDSPVTIEVADQGGEFSVGGGTDPDAVQNGVFYPELAGPGTHTIYYDIGQPCPDSDDIEVIVYENIEIQNFSDNVCDGADEYYTVSFDVVEDPGGAPAEFQVNDGGGFDSYTGSYSEQFPSQNNYNLTVTDLHDCDNIVLTGYTDCGCTTYAGTMNLQQVNLCEGDCTGGEIIHNDNEALDSNDAFEFILHDGSEYPADATSIIARNSTPDFCMTGAMTYETTYYVSAICGNEEGSTGHVVSDPSSDPCYSQATGTPVVWHENPVVTIDESNVSVCGLTVDLTGSVPNAGIGTWTSDSSFNAINGTTIHDHEISILAGDGYGEYEFTWEVDNNQCIGSDDVTVDFNQTPNAYAGNDTVVCGTSVDLQAEYSIAGSNGQWSGDGINFSPQGNANTTASLNSGVYGTYTITWTEINGTCTDEDYLNVTFVEKPQPSITNNNDTVCGLNYTLHAENVIGDGVWTAYDDDGDQVYPDFDNDTSPITNVTINSYSGHYRTIDFQWEETNSAYGLNCSDAVTTTVTFAEEPFSSVGDSDFAEVCGSEYTFNADTTGYGWADGNWIAKEVGVLEWDPASNAPDASVTIMPGAFGDSAYVETEFIWRMSSGGCSDLDTVTVAFYKKPNANAANDDEICGLTYELEAFYSLPDPYGFWYEDPENEGSANFQDEDSAVTVVNVSQPGSYCFIWRENNPERPNCNDRDTVCIEFKEKPVIDAGDDFDVCGKVTQLNATSAGFDGNWLDVSGANFDDFEDPETGVSYHAGYEDVEFVWQESNDECTSKDTVTVTFWQKPTAELAMDPEDTTACGRFFKLRAENPGSGVNGNWVVDPSNSVDFYHQEYNDTVEVTYYGHYDFYWTESNHPDNEPPTFCSDTSEPWTVHFIKIPEANAGIDTLFCGLEGDLTADFSVGTSTGEWANFSSNITFEDDTVPNTVVYSDVYTEGNPNYDAFLLEWTEDNYGCTDTDEILVRFARVPSADVTIIPPRCFGEPASIKANEDYHPEYNWELHGGIVDSTWDPVSDTSGNYRRLIHWVPEDADDTVHQISLQVVSRFDCASAFNDTVVFEPGVPGYEMEIFPDSCLLGKGGATFIPDSSMTGFRWIDTAEIDIPDPTDTIQRNIPAGTYHVSQVYPTLNQDHVTFYQEVFGDEICRDTFAITIDTVGMITADFEVAADIDLAELVAPEATVWFDNLSDGDELRTSNLWYFDDGESETNNDEQVEHIYTEPNDCYEPYLVVYARNLPECRDTAFMDCIKVDDRSNLEVPNIFTPNGDGINDYFQVKAQTLRSFHGKVVNRWGRTIYEWDNYEDEEAGWNGKLDGGTKASSGVYYYIIKGEGMDGYEYNLQGPFHLTK